MDINNATYQDALEIFEMQIQCVIDDDRESQMRLYDENLHYEFPFAKDRPKVIEGRNAFRQTMKPFWENRRKNKIQISLGKHEFHATDVAGLYLALFELNAIAENSQNSVCSTCVQLIKISNSRIIEVREYFEP